MWVCALFYADWFYVFFQCWWVFFKYDKLIYEIILCGRKLLHDIINFQIFLKNDELSNCWIFKTVSRLITPSSSQRVECCAYQFPKRVIFADGNIYFSAAGTFPEKAGRTEKQPFSS